MRFALLVLATLGLIRASSAEPSRVLLKADYDVGNLAWGFNSGGRDSVEGRKVVLVDLDAVSSADVAAYKADGHVVLCYVSVGTVEFWRPHYKSNKAAWDAMVVGTLAVWSDEAYLDIRDVEGVMALIGGVFAQAKALGCDAIEGDNMDAYQADEFQDNLGQSYTGKELREMQVAYMEALADAAHELGMAMVMKNAAGLVARVSDIFDGVLTENCLRWDECDVFTTHFTDKGKMHVNFEYNGPSAICSRAGSGGVRTRFCVANAGNYLCKSKVGGEAVLQWSDCLMPPDGPLPDTEYTQGDDDDDDDDDDDEDDGDPRDGEEPDPVDLSLDCALRRLNVTRPKKRPLKDMKQAPAGDYCTLVSAKDPNTAKLVAISLKPKLRDGDTLAVYRIEAISKAGDQATGAVLLRAEWTGTSKADRVFVSTPNMPLLVVLHRDAGDTGRRFGGKRFLKALPP